MRTFKTTIKTLFAVAVMSIAFSLNTKAQTPPQIEMRATAERQVTPNEIYVTITIKESDYKGKKTLQEMQNRMIGVLKQNRIDIPEALSLNYMGSNVSYKVFSSKIHPKSEATYQLKFNDATIMQKVIYDLEEVDISNIELTRTKYTNDEALITELGVEAIKKAQVQARAYAGVLGQEIGKAISINSWTSQNNPEPRLYKSRAMVSLDENAVDEAGIEPQISIGKINYGVTVTVIFELK